MHPAYSVILFTTTSGAGYGLLFWLGLGFGPARGGWIAVASLALALALITVGLLSSTFHLGHPERAWRAFSQWRTSWLSREGVAALVTYVPAGLLGLSFLFPTLIPGAAIYGALSALGALVTVWCTGMIYACLRTVPAWTGYPVAAAYMTLSLGTGGLLATCFEAFAGQQEDVVVLIWLVGLSLVAALLLKLRAWRLAGDGHLGFDIAEALGIPTAKDIRTLDPPHTQPNFVMREMGYSVARRHANRLRKLCVLTLFVIPLAALPMASMAPEVALWILLAATLSASLGVLLERWLFFAEAKHLSMLYYSSSTDAA